MRSRPPNTSWRGVVAVVRGGVIVEFGDCDQVTAHPQNDYTKRLLLAAPVADPVRQADRRAAFRALAVGA